VAAVAALDPMKVNEESNAIDKSSFFILPPCFRNHPAKEASRKPLSRPLRTVCECQRNECEKQKWRFTKEATANHALISALKNVGSDMRKRELIARYGGGKILLD
jgi:hypothetical protein